MGKDAKDKELAKKLKKEQEEQEAARLKEQLDGGSQEDSAGNRYVHVYIEESAYLECSQPTLDAIIQIEAFGKKHYTKVHKEIGPGSLTYWGEHFFFEKEFENSYEVAQANLDIKVFDHKTIGFDALVGTTSFSIESVNSEEDHAILHRWAALQNVDKDHQKLFGYLKVSVNVTKTGDKRLKLIDEGAVQRTNSEQKDMKSIMLPPQIKIQRQQLRIKVFRGERVVKMDNEVLLIGDNKVDPYLKFKFSGVGIKTSHQKQTFAPQWNEQVLMPSCFPTLSEKIHVSLKDWDALGNNEYIGSLIIDYKKVQAKKMGTPFWLNFYGGQEKVEDKKMKTIQNNIPELAPRFKGRVLMQIDLEDHDTPYLQVEKLLQKDIIQEDKPQQFLLIVDVEFVTNLYSTKEQDNVKIVINWGGKEAESKYHSLNQGVTQIFERIQMNEEFHIFNCAHLPDIIVYVEYKSNKERRSYMRLKTCKFKDMNRDYQNMYMVADNAVAPKLREDQSGVIKLRACWAPRDKWEKEYKNTVWANPPKRVSDAFKPVYIITNLFQAKNIAAGDESGLSDPIIYVYHYGSSLQSNVFPQTLNPNWNERIQMKTWIVNGQIPPLLLSLYDQDITMMGHKEFEFLGSSLIDFDQSNLTQDPYLIPKPKWVPIRTDKKNIMGKILVSFTILDGSIQFPQRMPRYIPITRKRHFLKFKILGLRNLQSLGIFPVSRPYIKIALNSLQTPEQARAMSGMGDITTEPKEPGPNPNIGTILCLELLLPTDCKLMPILTSNVFDCILKSTGSTLSIGAFEIDLGYFQVMTKVKIVNKLIKARTLLAKKNNLRVLENIEKVIKKFSDEINEGKTFVGIDEKELVDMKPLKLVNQDEINEKADGNSHETYDPFKKAKSIVSSSSQGQIEDTITMSMPFQNTTAEKQKVGLKSSSTLMNILPVKALKGGLAEAEDSAYPTKQLNILSMFMMNSSQKQGGMFSLPGAKKQAKKPVFDKDDPDVQLMDDTEAVPEIKTVKTSLANILGNKMDQNNGVTKIGPFGDGEGLKEEDPQLISENKESLIQLADSQAIKQEEFDEMTTMRQMPQGKLVSSLFVMQPNYKKVETKAAIVRREYEIPDPEQFVALGYDTLERRQKHYRYSLGIELEETSLMGSRNFKTIPIFRGRQAGQASFWERMINCFQEPVHKEVGQFKGSMDIINEDDLKAIKDLHLEKEGINLNIPTTVKDWSNLTSLELGLMKKKSVLIRVYVIDAELYESLDIGSENDPYLKISLGQTVIDDNKSAISDRNQPQFMKMYELKSTFPGPSHLSISVFDQDPIKFDELIGTTEIDVENRFYDEKWRLMCHVPIETRKLYHPSSKLEKGNIRLWLEIYTEGDKVLNRPINKIANPLIKAITYKQDEEKYQLLNKSQQSVDSGCGHAVRHSSRNMLWDISPRPKESFELRVIIWDVEGVPMADVEETVDIYISGTLVATNQTKQTDTHFRSQTGFGSFNWRLVYPLEIDEYTPQEALRLSLKIYDKDLIKSNDYLSEVTLDLKQLVQDAISSESRMKMLSGKKNEEKFVIETSPATGYTEAGKITLSVEILPKSVAEQNPVGHGRSDPNQGPFLPEPTGRFQFTLSPFKLFTQLVGPKFRKRCYLYMCAIFWICIFLLALPTLFGNLLTGILKWIF